MPSGFPTVVLRYLMARTWVSVVALVGVVVVAIATYMGLNHAGYLANDGLGNLSVYPYRHYDPHWCDVLSIDRGVNINHATGLVTSSGIAAALAVGVAAGLKRRRLVAGVLLVEALALCVAIGLVAADSATFVGRDCFEGTYGAFHLAWLYAAFGMPLALLLLRAFGAWKRVEPPVPRSRVLRLWETGA